uniref:Putative LOC100167595 [Acyrthosiphon pisum] n=1 Tax=Lepeophtheirus salmonis TaxID=72036 RepID=A0A0K2UR07_LEPSM
MTVGNRNKLIYYLKVNSSNILFYISDSELLFILTKTHLAIGHGGGDKMSEKLAQKFTRILPVMMLNYFFQLCETSQKKRKGAKRGKVVKPMMNFTSLELQKENNYMYYYNSLYAKIIW